jgi:hypothetical protein
MFFTTDGKNCTGFGTIVVHLGPVERPHFPAGGPAQAQGRERGGSDALGWWLIRGRNLAQRLEALRILRSIVTALV